MCSTAQTAVTESAPSATPLTSVPGMSTTPADSHASCRIVGKSLLTDSASRTVINEVRSVRKKRGFAERACMIVFELTATVSRVAAEAI